MKRLIVALVAIFAVIGCVARPGMPTGPRAGSAAATVPAIRGQISAMEGYHTALTNLLTQFAQGATISLIQVSNGQTVGTSLADDKGNFMIEFNGGTFNPAKDQPSDTRSTAYYLEAVRGIQGKNGAFNQAGVNSLRLRSMLWMDFAQDGWVGLTNATPSAVVLNMSTTAVSFFINQQIINDKPQTPANYIGCLDPARANQAPGDYTAAGDLTPVVYGNIFAQVANAVVNDQDPIANLVLGGGGIVVNTATNMNVSGITPASGVVGSQVTIAGQNMIPASVRVEFVGGLATLLPQSASNSLAVTVPPGARTGLVQVSLNGVTTYTPNFTVTTNDGHLTTFTDANGSTSLFALSYDIGTLVRCHPDGSTTTLNTSFTSPTAVLVNPEGKTAPPYHIYVADAGTNKIVQLQMQADGTALLKNSSWLAATDPRSMVMGPTGDLFVAQKSAGTILRAKVDWSLGTVTNGALATYSGLNGPAALAFDWGGLLYVVETAAGDVQRFLPGAGDSGAVAPALTPWAYMTLPVGITIDTAGNCFVTSPSQSAVFKIDPWRTQSAFRNLPGASAIARDASGNMYVSDNARNLIYRLTISGDQRDFAYGLSGLKGLAVDDNSNVYVSLSTSGAILKLSSDGVTTTPLIAGMAQPYGLTYRGGSLYSVQNETGTVAKISLGGAAQSVINSGLFYPGGVDVSGSTYYVGLRSPNAWTGADSWWMFGSWYPCYNDNGGIAIVTDNGATITRRISLVDNYNMDWNNNHESIVDLGNGSNNFVLANTYHGKLVLMTTLGNTNSQSIRDITPPSLGGRFPGTTYDVVYDGSRYLYVASSGGNPGGTVYRIDTTNYGGAPGVITGFTYQPYGLTIMNGVLYIADSPGASPRVRRVSAPASATTVDSGWAPATTGGFRGITNSGGNLYLANYDRNLIQRLAPAGAGTYSDYATLNGGPSRLRAFNNGKLVTRTGDAVYYLLTPSSGGATASVTTYISTIGCTGCSQYEFFIDASNRVFWSIPFQHNSVYAQGFIDTRSMLIDPTAGWLYSATSHGVYGMKLSSSDELSVTWGPVAGLALKPSDGTLYVLRTDGNLGSIDLATRTLTGRGALPAGGWGLGYDATAGKLYAAVAGNNTVVRVDPSTWAQTPLKVGLHATTY